MYLHHIVPEKFQNFYRSLKATYIIAVRKQNKNLNYSHFHIIVYTKYFDAIGYQF